MRPRQNEQMQIEDNKTIDSTTPWIQKQQYVQQLYSRPNNLDEVVHQQEVTTALKNVLKSKNLPHMLFYGPAGTGKTSTIIAFSKELYGPKFYRQRIKELNASDERGINVVRDKIKNFAKYMCAKAPDKSYPCPNFKIMILDEADLLTKQAQSALRRVIQDNSSTTRFCIICNYVTKIIEPLLSRCVKFRFKSIPEQVQLQKLGEICNKESINISQEQIKIILDKGDLRQAINSLQTLQKLQYVPQNILPVSLNHVDQIMKEIQSAQNIKQVVPIAEKFVSQGYAFDDIIHGLVKNVVRHQRNQRKQAILLEIIAKSEENLMLGAFQLPIMDLLTSIYYVQHLKL